MTRRERTTRSYAGLSREERQAERRQRVLDTAFEMFTTHGYHATTITELCSRATVAPVKFYEEFGNKESLLLSLCSELLIAGFRGRDEAMAQEQTLEGKIRVGMEVFCHSMLDDPRVARVLLIESAGVSDVVEQFRRAVQSAEAYRLLCNLYAMLNGTAKPTYDVSGPEHILAIALVGACNAAIIDWLGNPQPPPIETVVATLSDLFEGVALNVCTLTHVRADTAHASVETASSESRSRPDDRRAVTASAS